MLGIIRVLTHDDPHFVEEHGRLIHQAYAIASVSRCIPDQRKGIYDAESQALAIPKIVALGQALEAEGCNALFLSCAALLKRPVAVMGIGAEAPLPFKQLLGAVVSYARPEGVLNTTDLLTAQGRESALACADGLSRQGAEVIAFSCTGFSTIALADSIRAKSPLTRSARQDCLSVSWRPAANVVARGGGGPADVAPAAMPHARHASRTALAIDQDGTGVTPRFDAAPGPIE